MTTLLDTILLFSLPASGKSETRTFLSTLSPDQCRNDFGMGPTLQLDDYPYVHLMHRIDDELRAAGWKDLYYKGPTRPFQDDWTWAVLIELLNEDYAQLRAGRQTEVADAAEHLFDRLDAAHLKVGMHDVMGDVPHRIRRRVAQAIQADARHELDLLNRTCGQDPTGKTIVIEAARGGANGSAFPLIPPYGYATAFQTLDPAILERASVLYVWVDPAESRRKNIERGLPGPEGQASILNHSVPMEVMLGQYGCDDMGYLLEQSDRPGCIRADRIVIEDGLYKTRSFYLPAARFDNRKDLTSFIRKPQAQWQTGEIKAMYDGLRSAFDTLRQAQGVR